METNTPRSEELNRFSAHALKHLALKKLSHPKEMERVERFAIAVPYGLLLHPFPQRKPLFADKKVFGLLNLLSPQAGTDETGKAFMEALHATDTWRGVGKYMYHFNHFPHDDLFTSTGFTNPGNGQVIILDTCSRALNFSGKNPDIILTLFGSAELFSAQAALPHAQADKWLMLEMELTPKQYMVYCYDLQLISTFSISELMPCKMATVRRHRSDILLKVIAAGLQGVKKV